MYNLRATFLTILYILFHSQICWSLKDVINVEYDLYKALFQNYSNSVRPVEKWSDRLDVEVDVSLRKIADVIESDQTLMIYVRLEMKWTDVNLKWDINKYNVESIVVPADTIWIPDLHLFNSAAENDRIYPLNAEIFSNGTVLTYPVSQLFAHCDFSFSDFPYDTQDCEFIIGTTIDKQRINVSLVANADPNRLIPNSEWSYVHIKVMPEWIFRVSGMKEMFNSDWSVSKITLTIKRSSAFFVNLFVWPLILILFIGMSIFILPPTCVERSSMGVLLLLSVVILSLMLESYTPRNSTSVSVVGKLVGFTMFMVTWSTVISTLIIGIDRDNFTSRSLPQWLRNLMIRYVSKIVCKEETINATLNTPSLNRLEDIEIIDTSVITQASQQIQNETNNRSEANQNTNSLLVDTLDTPTGAAATTATTTTASTSSVATREVANNNSSKLDFDASMKLLILIHNQISKLRMRLQEKEVKDHNKRDWYLIACSLDRFFLIVYTIIMFLGIFIIFI